MSRIVLILNTADEPSETFQRALAVDLAEDGHEVVIYAISGDLPPDGSLHPRVSYARLIPSPRASGALVAEVLHHSGPTRAALRRARARWGRGRRANSAALGVARLAALEPEVIHLGFSGIGASLADVFDIWDDVPVVVSCRGSDELVRPSFDADRRERLARIFQRATIVHCVADAVADAAIDLGAPETSVRVVRPAVDLDRWVPAPRPAPGPPWRLVSTTRLVPAKGTEDLLAAMAMLIEGGTEVTLEVIGSGPHRDALRLRAMRTGIADRVEFAGAVAPDEVRRRLRGAHLYVSPSLSEGISNGVLEAMASGVPVVSTDVGGMAEVIDAGVDGWLAPPGRPDLLAATIARAISDADGLAAVAAAGRAKVASAHRRSVQASAWRAIYDSLLGRGSVAAVGTSPAQETTPPHE